MVYEGSRRFQCGTCVPAGCGWLVLAVVAVAWLALPSMAADEAIVEAPDEEAPPGDPYSPPAQSGFQGPGFWAQNFTFSVSVRTTRIQRVAGAVSLLLGPEIAPKQTYATRLMLDAEIGTGGWKVGLGLGGIWRRGIFPFGGVPIIGGGTRLSFYEARQPLLHIVDGTQYIGLEGDVRVFCMGYVVGVFQRVTGERASVKTFFNVGFMIWF